jgi:hypothetical protein
LSEIYNLLLAGCAKGEHPMDAYDYLLMLILLEEEYVSTDILKDYFLPRLNNLSITNITDIENNLKLLIGEYGGSVGVPMFTLISRMFYTEDSAYIQEYNHMKNIYIIIYN